MWLVGWYGYIVLNDYGNQHTCYTPKTDDSMCNNISVSVSSDGMYVYIIASDCNYNNYWLHKSASYGASFIKTSVNSLDGYSSVQVSIDGRYVIVNSNYNQDIYISNDYGLTFTYKPAFISNNGGATTFPQVAISKSGQYIYSNKMYSTSYGSSFQSWNSAILSLGLYARSVACSSTGQYVLFIYFSNGNIMRYLSSDYGGTFQSSGTFSNFS